jgi:putative ABC transport system permease protein
VLLSEVPVDAGRRETICRGGCSVSYQVYDRTLKPYPFRSLDALAGFTSGAKSLNRGGDALLLNGGVVSPSLFGLLGGKPLLGRTFTSEDDRLGTPLTTILSYPVWANHFGSDPGIVGQDIKLSDSHYTIIGVMPPEFRFEVDSDFWLATVPTLDPSTRPSIRSLYVVGRLAPGRNLEQLRAEVAGIELPPSDGEKTRIVASPLRERYASSTASHDLIFGAIVGFVLLIACANLANLVLVRTIRQQREHAIRAALGANPARLARLVLLQNAIVVFFSTILGVALAASVLGILRSVSSLAAIRPMGMEYRIDARVLGFAVLIAGIAGAVISLAPARIAAKGNVQHMLKTMDRGTGISALLRQGFVVTQVACATVLFSGAFLMARTALHFARVNLGFEADRLLTGSPSYPHPWRVPATYLPLTERIRTELAQIPGVAAVAIRASVPIPSRDAASAFTLEGSAEPLSRSQAPNAALGVSPGYFATIGVPLITGRDFTEHDDTTSLRVAIVNRWAASHWWPGQSALGRSIRFAGSGGKPVTVSVIGVVGDHKAAQPNLLLAQEGPELYLPYLQSHSAFPLFLVRAQTDPASLERPVRLALTRLVPDRPVFTAPMQQTVARQLDGVRSNAWQIGGFALVGLFLTVIGVYGVLAFETGRRSREIGIRNALGAGRPRLLGGVLLDAGRLAGLGILAGIPLAVLTTRFIRALLYSATAPNPLAYAAVALGVTLVALLAALGPALRASRISPLVAMQAE